MKNQISVLQPTGKSGKREDQGQLCYFYTIKWEWDVIGQIFLKETTFVRKMFSVIPPAEGISFPPLLISPMLTAPTGQAIRKNVSNKIGLKSLFHSPLPKKITKLTPVFPFPGLSGFPKWHNLILHQCFHDANHFPKEIRWCIFEKKQWDAWCIDKHRSELTQMQEL